MSKWITKEGRTLTLLRPNELPELPKGTVLYSIDDERVVVGEDYIDGDTRGRYLAYGREEAS